MIPAIQLPKFCLIAKMHYLQNGVAGGYKFAAVIWMRILNYNSATWIWKIYILIYQVHGFIKLLTVAWVKKNWIKNGIFQEWFPAWEHSLSHRLHYSIADKCLIVVGRQKAPAQNTSLMVSESELDSDEAIFTWPDREKGKLLQNQNGSIHNGQIVHKTKKNREAVL